MISERRLLRAEPDFGLITKLWRVNWAFVLLLCALAGCGYVALYLGRRRPGTCTPGATACASV